MTSDDDNRLEVAKKLLSDSIIRYGEMIYAEIDISLFRDGDTKMIENIAKFHNDIGNCLYLRNLRSLSGENIGLEELKKLGGLPEIVDKYFSCDDLKES